MEQLAKHALFMKDQISSADSREIYVIDVYTAPAYTPMLTIAELIFSARPGRSTGRRKSSVISVHGLP